MLLPYRVVGMARIGNFGTPGLAAVISVASRMFFGFE